MSQGATKAELMAALQRHINKSGLRMTRQRQVIAEVLFSVEGHVNIDELYRAVQRRDPNVGYATIYRTLKLLTEAGIAASAQFGDGPMRFEAALHRDHHDHLICTSCGRIIEFENEEIERLQETVVAEHGFTMTDHKMEIYGLCPTCQTASVE
ncbi:MAG: Fur family ferric uptake transcriptional regulator [Myxococcota bacterium]|jgi:Fur family ferric uptake transcriptional regulator